MSFIQYLNSLPTLEDVPNVFDIYTQPIPNSIFLQNNEIPYIENVKNILEITPPLPQSIWQQQQGEIPKIPVIDIVKQCISTPYPAGVMIQDEDLPRYLCINAKIMGAFANCKKLKEIIIPETVKKLGKYTFRNTILKDVTIAEDCIYYSTTFPNDCMIHIYGREDTNFLLSEGSMMQMSDENIFNVKEN